MKRASCSLWLAWIFALVGVSGPLAAADAKTFGNDQIEQLVAPIALYPDTLLTQVLIASTYPLELVEAERWRTRNPKLTGKELDAALKDQTWDPSVKSLCAVPDVLKRMSENLDWTQDLGDAFLAQKAEVMDTVQRMRGKALDVGNLKSTEQQVVTRQPDKIIVIEQASPQVVYVPSYSPTVVYGTWSYPSYYYPPMYAPPPPGYGLMAFGVGMAVGAAFWGDCNWGWGHGDVDIDINRYNEFNRNTSINSSNLRVEQRGSGNRGSWQHDPSHRKGVNYRSQDVAGKFGAQGGSNRVTRDQARGFSQPRASTRESAASRQGGNRPQTADRSRGDSSRRSAYSGSRSPSTDRAASSRGSMSRGTSSFGGGGRSMRSGGGGRRR